MKKKVSIITLSTVIVLTGIAVAAILFLTVSAAPFSSAMGSATVTGVSNLYLTVLPNDEIPFYVNTILVYENNNLIYTGNNIIVNQMLIASYTNDARRNYTLVVQNGSNCTLTGKLLYDWLTQNR